MDDRAEAQATYAFLTELGDGEISAANEAYGALREGVHIAGYSFERACIKLEWLLKEDRWRHIGHGFDDVNRFLDCIQLENLRLVVEQRKRITKLIKALQPSASNRRIAKALGVAEGTIRNDTAADSAAVNKKLNQINGEKTPTAQNYAPDKKIPNNINEEDMPSGACGPPSTGNAAPPDRGEALPPPLQIVLGLLPKLTDAECAVVRRALDNRKPA
ncbi:hypothetical protein JQ617_12945 [Bradyrhizobium sp. KB893862 SZCCT0404]|uniref:AsnC family protein n=1 Tax=Bradyrhizobium sp. KB893862 SZCCT0404 TaxID=2807672 RepID=UPI001BA9F816|nr:AsnC family protein [Bradyrhizobium sp. KB893862 SZCCT0404]MBR1174869.1 hypothetical protein [Bradyrhizobium sp. KB893862 SZCCT0404]